MSPCPHLTGGGNKMKSVLRVVAALSLVFAASHAAAQTDYPNRQIRIIVGFTAGTAPDVAARILATKFAETWNVPVTVEDITGAGSNIATDRVAKAAPDGYTLLMGGNPSLVINPSLYVKLPFDPVKDSRRSRKSSSRPTCSSSIPTCRRRLCRNWSRSPKRSPES
jgi:tripartite-type tricarboxylate transporter receptor subunit TctC